MLSGDQINIVMLNNESARYLVTLHNRRRSNQRYSFGLSGLIEWLSRNLPPADEDGADPVDVDWKGIQGKLQIGGSKHGEEGEK